MCSPWAVYKGDGGLQWGYLALTRSSRFECALSNMSLGRAGVASCFHVEDVGPFHSSLLTLVFRLPCFLLLTIAVRMPLGLRIMHWAVSMAMSGVRYACSSCRIDDSQSLWWCLYGARV
jgi:hypothetical protein